MRTLLIALLIAGCCHPKPCPKCPDPLAPVEVRVQCLTEAPPKPAPVAMVAPLAICQPDPNGGGPQLVGCLDATNAMALERNVKAMQRWIKEAWARCGKAP